MRIAIASGKGGTGKTTVATNLAKMAARNGVSVAYLDCDVEEPNGHLFLRPEVTDSRQVDRLIPVVDAETCIHCGKCGEICQYSAIVSMKEKVLVFPELCHSCGGCMLVCPVDAIHEEPRPIGKMETGDAEGIAFVHGLLDIGQAMSPPVIRAVRAAEPEADIVILDAPPGTSCPVIESVRGSDFVLLVTEPTPFGLNDLKLAVEMIRALALPFAVAINRAGTGDRETHVYCEQSRIPILAEIPDDRRIAEAYSTGQLACEACQEYQSLFSDLLSAIEKSLVGQS
jgi:MinD superfamily P-loop ATPase